MNSPAANLQDIKKFLEWGVLDGVTTNPSKIAEEKTNFEKRIKEIGQLTNLPIHAEVIATQKSKIIEEAEKIASWYDKIIVKIPTTAEGLKAITVLRKKGIKTNATIVFSPAQAYLAAKAKANITSLYIGRTSDVSYDGMIVLKEIVDIFKKYKFKTKVLAASIRSPRDITQAAKIGADIITISPKYFDKLIKHPQTDIGIQKFLDKWNKVKSISNF